MQQPTPLVSLTVLLPTLVVGLSLWLSARTRRGVLFGISVPLEFADSPEAEHLVTRYRIRILLLSVVAGFSCLPIAMREVPWLSMVALPWLIIGGIVMWQLARRKIKPHEIVPPVERSAGIGAGTGVAWFIAIALALTPLACTWLYLRRHWEEIPARFPVHFDINGVANRWATRSPGSVAMPLIIGAAVIVFMIFIAGFMRLTPTVDRERATRVMFPTLAAISWSMSMVFCWVALMPLGRMFGPKTLIVVIGVHMVVVLGIVVWMIWRLMQTQGEQAYDGTPDSMWRAGGMLYCNPSDAAVMVPKRLGWGWTLNFARPAAWWYLGAILLLVVVIGVLPFLLK